MVLDGNPIFSIEEEGGGTQWKGKFHNRVEQSHVVWAPFFLGFSFLHVFYCRITITTIVAKGPVIHTRIPTRGKHQETRPTRPPIV
jgi:hypothetical protein